MKLKKLTSSSNSIAYLGLSICAQNRPLPKSHWIHIIDKLSIRATGHELVENIADFEERVTSVDGQTLGRSGKNKVYICLKYVWLQQFQLNQNAEKIIWNQKKLRANTPEGFKPAIIKYSAMNEIKIKPLNVS